MEDSNDNNLNWTSDACEGVAMFGENDVQGVEVSWHWATAVRLSMCFGFRSSGLVRVARMCVKTLDCGSADDGYALDFRRLVRDLRYRGRFVRWNIVADLHGTLLPNL